MRSPDVPALVAGLVITAFGGALVADAAGGLDLSWGTTTPMVCAAVGATLLALGLSRRS